LVLFFRKGNCPGMEMASIEGKRQESGAFLKKRTKKL
jgi:hypothetical protein